MTIDTEPTPITALRPHDRKLDELRPVSFTPNYTRNAYASVLVEFGNTRVLCTASREERVPKWLQGNGVGWVTAEYDMLPAATGERRRRDARKGRMDGRTIEISRLIGRSLRAVVDREALGEQLITVDCDVIDADGGTRCAAICGGYVALYRAFKRMVSEELIDTIPLTDSLGAVSIGILDTVPHLDLEYVEDSVADVDMNLVATGQGRLVEAQASAEGATFTRAEFDAMIDLGLAGIARIGDLQKAACEA